MLEIVPPLLAVLGTATISATGWFSKRATHEGRLLLRIERLGAAYSVLPDTPEKKQLEAHVLRAAAALNDWLDVDAQILRRIQWVGAASAAVLGVLISSLIVPGISSPGIAWLTSFAVGLALGVAVLVVVLIAQAVLEKRVRRRERARTAERYAALARGEKPEI